MYVSISDLIAKLRFLDSINKYAIMTMFTHIFACMIIYQNYVNRTVDRAF